MVIGWLILLVFLIGALIGIIASQFSEDEKDIYKKYFKYFLILIIIVTPFIIFFTNQNFLILIFAFSLILFWNYTNEILRFFGIKRHKKKK